MIQAFTPKKKDRIFVIQNISNITLLPSPDKSPSAAVQLPFQYSQPSSESLWTCTVNEKDIAIANLATQDRDTNDAEKFLSDLYLLVRSQNIDLATDRVYDHLHKLLSSESKEIEACCKIFELAKIERLNSAVMRSLLLLTSRDKRRIWPRRGFFEKAFKSIAKTQGAGKAERLLGRLR